MNSNLAETQKFWYDWLDREYRTRLSDNQFTDTLIAGMKLIENDPELWGNISMWNLYDAITKK